MGQDEQTVAELARLLLGVARLGDGDLCGWWRSNLMDPDVGPFTLGNAFPRTSRIAAAELLLLSAARRHDHVVDRAHVLHLFSPTLRARRLVAGWLAEAKSGPRPPQVDELLLELRSWRDVEVGWEALRSWVGPDAVQVAAEGVERTGVVELAEVTNDDLEDDEAMVQLIREMAAAYIGRAQLVPAVRLQRAPSPIS